jgi:bacillithiol synthase
VRAFFWECAGWLWPHARATLPQVMANRAPVAPLESWAPVHPAASAAVRGEIDLPPVSGQTISRSAALAEALRRANRSWGSPVDAELSRWLAGADVVVTGQQPGLLGGPLLTLVKAAAVAAEVRRLRSAGREAVGFLWLATGDDDLPEMGWGRVAVGEELLEVREPGWERAARLGGAAPLSGACASFLEDLRTRLPGGNAAAAIDLAASCYTPTVTLGEATAAFLARLLAGSGVILVDALEPELAQAGSAVVGAILSELPACWEALEAGAARFHARGWSVPLRIASHKLPVFRRRGDRRESVPTNRKGCPPAVLEEVSAHPERFLPNAWLRPLVQDASLDTSVAILGGAELAYHVQTAEARAVAGIGRPRWLLRPHVTVVTSAERRLARQLGVEPEHLLRPQPPVGTLPGKATRRRLERLHSALGKEIGKLVEAARGELPALDGDVEATAKKLDAALAWLDGRVTAAANRDAEVELGRWRRLRAFLRPEGAPQERHLSVLAPLLRLGLEWPQQLVAGLDPSHPGMQLLFWEEGGQW